MMQFEAIETEILQKVTAEQAWHYTILPTKYENEQLNVLIGEKAYHSGIEDELELILDVAIQVEKIEDKLLQQYLAKYYRKKQQGRITVESPEEGEEDYVRKLVQEAKLLGSSDIHFEPFEFKSRVRMRVDGKLVERFVLKKEQYPSLVNKIKIQANLDISEKRLPQDGRIFLKLSQSDIDIRVSILPTLHGEKVVLRLLNNDAGGLDLTQLGFDEKDLQTYLNGVRRPNGIVLISGPTGSGKTTTLYATLKKLNQPDTNIITIEDPIEYTLEGINQVQLKESIGLNFPKAMKTFLRQDPDIIMVGEIRDRETAEMAIRASLTGHLVFSTIHTNSAWGIISRLIDMGIPSYLIADTLNTAVAQRLLRLLCPSCKEKLPFSEEEYPFSFKAPKVITHKFEARGCEACHYTGYTGRKAVYEVIGLDYDLSKKIKAVELDVKEMLEKKGIATLTTNAFQLFSKGLTSIEEVYPILANG